MSARTRDTRVEDDAASRECGREEGVARSHSQRHVRSHRDEGLDREYATSLSLSLSLSLSQENAKVLTPSR